MIRKEIFEKPPDGYKKLKNATTARKERLGTTTVTGFTAVNFTLFW